MKNTHTRFQRSVAAPLIEPLETRIAPASFITVVAGDLQIFDAGEHAGSPYLVLEFVAGGTLADRLGRDEPDSRGRGREHNDRPCGGA